MKYHLTLLSFLAVAACCATPTGAFATIRHCTTAIYIWPGSEAEGDTANVLDLNTTNCKFDLGGGLYTCGDSARPYIEFGDKQLFAMALMAQAKGGTWRVDFDDSATSKGNTPLGTHGCRVVSISY